MRYLTLLALFALVGCGAGSSSMPLLHGVSVAVLIVFKSFDPVAISAEDLITRSSIFSDIRKQCKTRVRPPILALL